MNNGNKVKIVKFLPLSLYKDKDDNAYANLSWSIRMGYPRVSVYTDNRRDMKGSFDFNKLITAPFDAITINTFLDNFKRVILNKDAIKLSIKCFNVKYVNDVKTDQVYLQATVICGKDADGVIYLAVVSDDKEKVKFELLPGKWHVFVDENGGEISNKGELSYIHAMAYYNRLKSLMDKYLADDADVKYTESKNKQLTSS